MVLYYKTTFEEKNAGRGFVGINQQLATWPEFERKLEDFISQHTKDIQTINQATERLQACRQMCHEYIKYI